MIAKSMVIHKTERNINNITTSYTIENLCLILFFNSGHSIEIAVENKSIDVVVSMNCFSHEIYEGLLFTKLFEIECKSVTITREQE